MGYANKNIMIDYRPAGRRIIDHEGLTVHRPGSRDHRGEWRPAKTRRETRPTTCTEDGCTTRLSKYNLHTDKCSAHEHSVDSIPVRQR